MLSPSEQEREHYRTVAELIYEGKPNEKVRLNLGAKMVLAEIKKGMPDLDDESARTFLAAIGYLVASLSKVPLHDIGNVLEATFDHHMLAVASLMGFVNLDEGEDSGPTVDELIARRKAREEEYREYMNHPSPNTGLYL